MQKQHKSADEQEIDQVIVVFLFILYNNEHKKKKNEQFWVASNQHAEGWPETDIIIHYNS